MILEARDLVSGYGRIPVLHSVSLSLEEGEAIAVVGPNGAGKSTLMKTLARHLPVLEGDLRFRGERYAHRDAVWAARHGIALVPQAGNVFPGLTVAENLRIGARGHPRPDRAIEEAMRRFPVLRERASQMAGSLSGGERQILAISSALLMRPTVLLLDEPTSGLSPLATDEIVRWISTVVEGGTSVVWVVEQTPEPVLERVRRAYVLEAGQVRFEGDASELLGAGKLEELFLQRS